MQTAEVAQGRLLCKEIQHSFSLIETHENLESSSLIEAHENLETLMVEHAGRLWKLIT